MEGVYLVKDFHKGLGIYWAERGRATGGLFGPQSRGNDEGDKLRVDS